MKIVKNYFLLPKLTGVPVDRFIFDKPLDCIFGRKLLRRTKRIQSRKWLRSRVTYVGCGLRLSILRRTGEQQLRFRVVPLYPYQGQWDRSTSRTDNHEQIERIWKRLYIQSVSPSVTQHSTAYHCALYDVDWVSNGFRKCCLLDYLSVRQLGPHWLVHIVHIDITLGVVAYSIPRRQKPLLFENDL